MKTGRLFQAALAIMGALSIASCSDNFPPASDGGPNGTGTAQLLLTEIISEDEGRMVTINADATGRRELGEGVVISEPHNGKMAYLIMKNDSTAELHVAQTSGQNGTLVRSFIYSTSTQSGERIQGMGTVLSPDGSQVLYVARTFPQMDDEAIYIVSATGGTPRMLADRIGHEITPAFSPDGQRVAYYDDSGQLRVVSASGGAAFVIADSTMPYHDGYSHLEWSPDGSRIAFTRDNDSPSRSDIYTVAADGSSLRKVADDGRWPTWSPDGTKIIYVEEDGMYMVNADGTGQQQLPNPQAEPVRLYPQWSADGKQVVYTAYYGQADQAPGVIRVLDIASGAVTTLSNQGYKGFWLK
jgi:Tol biopolymer transport system component